MQPMEMNSAMVAMDSGAAASRARVAMDGMLALRFILSAAVGKMVSLCFSTAWTFQCCFIQGASGIVCWAGQRVRLISATLG